MSPIGVARTRDACTTHALELSFDIGRRGVRNGIASACEEPPLLQRSPRRPARRGERLHRRHAPGALNQRGDSPHAAGAIGGVGQRYAGLRHAPTSPGAAARRALLGLGFCVPSRLVLPTGSACADDAAAVEATRERPDHECGCPRRLHGSRATFVFRCVVDRPQRQPRPAEGREQFRCQDHEQHDGISPEAGHHACKRIPRT